MIDANGNVSSSDVVEELDGFPRPWSRAGTFVVIRDVMPGSRRVPVSYPAAGRILGLTRVGLGLRLGLEEPA
jgi:hypothetical protein